MRHAHRLLIAITAASTIAVAPPHTHAATRTWDGSSSSSWFGDSNWTPAGEPVDGDTVIIGSAPRNPSASSLVSFNDADIFFNSGADPSFNAGLFLGTNNTLTIASGAFAFASYLDASNATNFLDLQGGTLDLGGELSVGWSGTTTIATNIQGSAGSVAKYNAGTLIMAGSNSFEGGLTIHDGTVEFSGGPTLGGLGNFITFNGGTLRKTTSGAVILPMTINSGGGLIDVPTGVGFTYAASISGAGALTKENLGSLTLSKPNSYTGGTNILNGDLIIGGADADDIISSTGNVHLDAFGNLFVNSSETIGGLSGGGFVALNDHLTVNAGNQTTTSNAVIYNTGNLTKAGTGKLTLTNNNTATGTYTINDGTLELTGQNTPTGTINVNGSATLIIGGADATDILPNRVINIAPAATLQIDSAEDIARITGSGQTLLNDNLTLNHGSTDASYAGDINGPGALTKTGSGSLFFTGQGDHSGPTTISAGEIAVSSGGHLRQSTLTIPTSGRMNINSGGGVTATAIDFTGGTLNVNNNGDLFAGPINVTTGSFVIVSGGDVEADSVAGNGTIQINAGGDLTLNGGDLNWNQTGAKTIAGSIHGTGGLTKSGPASSSLLLSGVNTYTGNTTIASGTLTLAGPDATDILDETGTVNITSSFGTLNVPEEEDIGPLTGFGTVNMTENLTVVSHTNSTYLGDFDGPGTLIKSGTETLTLSHTPTDTAILDHTGDVQVNQGTLALDITAQNAGTITVAGGTLQVTGGIDSPVARLHMTAGNTELLGGATINVPDFDITAGNFDFSQGTVTLTGDNSNLSGDSSITIGTGGAGTLNVNGDTTAGDLTLQGTDDRINIASGKTLTVDSLDNTAMGTVDFAAGTISVNPGGTFTTKSAVVPGRVTGAGGITKIGPGVTTLTNGGNNYSGDTNVNDGTLVVGLDAVGLPAYTISGLTDVNLSATATLHVKGQGVYVADITGPAGSTVLLELDLSLGCPIACGLIYGTPSNTTFDGNITGNGDVVYAVTGVSGLTGSHDYTGSSWIAGTLELKSSASVSDTSFVEVLNAAKLRVMDNASLTAGQIRMEPMGQLTIDSPSATVTTANLVAGSPFDGTIAAGAPAIDPSPIQFTAGTLNIFTAGTLNLTHLFGGSFGGSLDFSARAEDTFVDLRVDDDMTLNVEDTVLIRHSQVPDGPAGLLWIDGGTFATGNLVVQDDPPAGHLPGEFRWDTGTVRFTGPFQSIPLIAEIQGSATSIFLTPGKELVIDGTAVFQTADPATVYLLGGSFTAGSVDTLEHLRPGSGTFNLTTGDFTLDQPFGDPALATGAGAGLTMDVGTDATINVLAGTTTIMPGSTLNVLGAFNGQDGWNDGELNTIGGAIVFAGPLTNTGSGRISATGATLTLPGDGVSNDDGLINLGVLNLTNTTVNGDVRSPAGSTINVASNVTFNGLVSGAANFPGAGLVTFNGGYAPGDSPADINFSGSLALGPSATFFIEVQNPTSPPPVPGVDNDRVNVTGNVTLGGTLEISSLSDLTTFAAGTPLGAEFTVMTYGTRTADSMFDAITGTLINPSFALAPLFTDTDTDADMLDDTLILRALVPGDIDGNLAVNVADLAVLALNFGTSPGLYDEAAKKNSWERGDFNADGIVSVADLSLLALNFGFDAADPTSTPTPLSLDAAATLAGIDLAEVPEPATLTMLAVLALTPRRRLA